MSAALQQDQSLVNVLLALADGMLHMDATIQKLSSNVDGRLSAIEGRLLTLETRSSSQLPPPDAANHRAAAPPRATSNQKTFDSVATSAVFEPNEVQLAIREVESKLRKLHQVKADDPSSSHSAGFTTTCSSSSSLVQDAWRSPLVKGSSPGIVIQESASSSIASHPPPPSQSANNTSVGPLPRGSPPPKASVRPELSQPSTVPRDVGPSLVQRSARDVALCSDDVMLCALRGSPRRDQRLVVKVGPEPAAAAVTSGKQSHLTAWLHSSTHSVLSAWTPTEVDSVSCPTSVSETGVAHKKKGNAIDKQLD